MPDTLLPWCSDNPLRLAIEKHDDSRRVNPVGVSLTIPTTMLDMQFVQREVIFFQNHIAILNFVGPAPLDEDHKRWLLELQDILRMQVYLYKDADGGFFFLKTKSDVCTQTLVGLTPCRLASGIAIIQHWIPCFNPSKPISILALH